MKLTQTERTKVNQTPDRASYEQDLLYSIIDSVYIGHIAFTTQTGSHSIPLAFWRIDDFIYCHCSANSRLTKLSDNKQEVCISFAIVDGIVFAKSAFRHSLNYRSAVVYGQFECLKNNSEKLKAMKHFVESIDKTRWDKIRTPNEEELDATTIMKMSLKEAVAKVRTGPATDKECDKDLDVWTGIIPYLHQYGDPIE